MSLACQNHGLRRRLYDHVLCAVLSMSVKLIVCVIIRVLHVGIERDTCPCAHNRME